jgi:hypothetical protein
VAVKDIGEQGSNAARRALAFIVVTVVARVVFGPLGPLPVSTNRGEFGMSGIASERTSPEQPR